MYLYRIGYLIEIKDVPESKPLVDYLRTLKYIKVKDDGKEIRKYHFTDEEMALLMRKKPTKDKLSEFLDRKQGKGAGIETVPKRVLTNLAKKRID